MNRGVSLAAFILSFRPDCKDAYYVPVATPAQAIAKKHGLDATTVKRWCRLGRVRGAVMNPATREWSVFPPCQLVNIYGVSLPWPDKTNRHQYAKA